jgi:FkbM family methyltransferase
VKLLWVFYRRHFVTRGTHFSVRVVVNGKTLDMVLHSQLAGALVNRLAGVHQLWRSDDLQGSKTIMDLGACYGVDALFFAAYCPGATIIAVEPERGNLENLRRNLESNSGLARFVVFPYAVGASEGTRQLHVRPARPLSHSVVFEEGGPSEPQETQCTTVPEIMRRVGVDTVDFMKVNVEGAEREILSGADGWPSRVRAIVGHRHDNYPRAELLRDLQRSGFRVREAAGAFFAIREA